MWNVVGERLAQVWFDQRAHATSAQAAGLSLSYNLHSFGICFVPSLEPCKLVSSWHRHLTVNICHSPS